MVSLFFCNLQVTILKTWRFYSFIYLFIIIIIIIIIIFDMEERHHLHRVFTQSPLEEMHSNREYKIYKEMHVTSSESTQPLQQ